MRDLDRAEHELHAACVPGSVDGPTPTFQMVSRIADLQLRPVDFGPELYGRSLRGKLRAVAATVKAVPGLAGLALFVNRKKMQVIHTSDRPRDSLACVLLARLTGAKCIVHAHVGYGEWMSPLLKWSLTRADALIAVSDFVGRTLVSSGHDSTKIHVVLNAIDPADWSPGEGRDDARHGLGIPPDALVIVTVCRLFPAKGPGDLIRALPALRQECPDVRLVIVGEEMVVGYRKQLEDLASELGVADTVVFTGRRKDVSRLMAAADVYAMPSLEEPFGLVFLEAMAMKLPVVALDSGGASEVVTDGASGLLSRPGDALGLRDNLLALLRDPDRRERMGAEGRARVEAQFTTSRMAADTARVYRQLLARSTVESNSGRGRHGRDIGRYSAGVGAESR